MFPIKLYADGDNGGTPPAPPKQKTDLDIQYQLQPAIKEFSYGAQFGERIIQVVKNKYEAIPDAVTNAVTNTLTQPAYVIDSADGDEIDTKKNYLDKLDDNLFKILAEAHVIVLGKDDEPRYIKALSAATNTTPLPARKK